MASAGYDRPRMLPAWSTIPDQLTAWHAHGDRNAAAEAIRFLEIELRLAFPPAARRRWPSQQLDDALQGFLTRLLQRPLPTRPTDPNGYLKRAFRNWCVSIERRNREIPTDDAVFVELPATTSDAGEIQQQRDHAIRAVGALRIEDRVAIKLVDAPEWLNDVELGWLAERADLTTAAVSLLVQNAPDILILSILFDPGPEPTTVEARRTRLERFRKRRNRARDALIAALEQA